MHQICGWKLESQVLCCVQMNYAQGVNVCNFPTSFHAGVQLLLVHDGIRERDACGSSSDVSGTSSCCQSVRDVALLLGAPDVVDFGELAR